MNEERQGNGLDSGARSAAERSGAAEARSLGEILASGRDDHVSQATETGDSQTQRLSFTADGWEYFRIWIVNVALTLLTLGIYSAWAKVRARRYLYGHIWLGDTAFDYTANPVAILRGRILVAIVAVGLWFASIYGILYYYALLAALAPLVPWVVIRARTFQLRNSRHRGIAFDFKGRFWDAAVWYPLMAVASFVTLGLAWPFRIFGRDRFLITESRFGDKPFRFTGEASPYYGAYVFVWVMGGILFIGSCFVLVGMVAMEPDAEAPPPAANLVMPLFFALAGLISFVYIRTRLLSYRWSCTQLGDTDFILQLSFGTMFWLYASNTALIIVTLGLFSPFARIRVLRYVVDQFLVMQPLGEITFEAGDAQRLGATGAEAAGEFGLEIGI